MMSLSLSSLSSRPESGQSPTQNLAPGPWVLSGLTQAIPKKIALFAEKFGQKWAKIGKNRRPELAHGQKTQARTQPGPKNARSSPTQNEKPKNLRVFSYSKNKANFEAFYEGKIFSKNLLF